VSITIHCKYDALVNSKKLKNHPKNRNKHGQDQIERLAAMYKYHGIRHPIIVSNQSGLIVAGHGRKLAALRAGIEEFPVEYQDFASQEAEYAFLQADNAVALWAELDIAGINEDLPELGPDFDIAMLGIKDFTLDPSEKEDGHGDPDEIPEDVPTKAKLGDLFILGGHRLICGDSTDLATVERLMNGEKADMVFTSPPYNGDTHLDYGNGNDKALYNNDFDAKTSGEYIDFCHSILNICHLICEGFIFWNVNYNSKSRFEYIKSIYPFVEKLHETIIWKKTGMPISNGLTRNCEFIFVFKNGERKHLSAEFKTEFNLWDISNINSQDKGEHRACFPIALPEKGIMIASEKGQSVFEPFGGSGTTLIACEKTKRKCFMMELDPHYIDVIIARWQKFIGKKAVREDGVLWDDIEAFK